MISKKPKYVQSFGRKGGRTITPRKKDILQNFLTKISITSIDETTNLKEKISPKSFFENRYKKIWLEIGFGRGEHLAHQANNNLDVGIIGSEVYIAGVAECAKKICDNKTELTNVRIFQNDARLLIDNIEDNSLDKIFILFPDPWPKKRHNKRRLFSAESLPIFHRVLKKGGVLRIATDHADYQDWIFDVIKNQKIFKPLFNSREECLTQPADHIITRYQQKAIEEGRISNFIEIEKI
jgi:tRNA (guanine-N7-)-methyltransferase